MKLTCWTSPLTSDRNSSINNICRQKSTSKVHVWNIGKLMYIFFVEEVKLVYLSLLMYMFEPSLVHFGWLFIHGSSILQKCIEKMVIIYEIPLLIYLSNVYIKLEDYNLVSCKASHIKTYNYGQMEFVSKKLYRHSFWNEGCCGSFSPLVLDFFFCFHFICKNDFHENLCKNS